jgi:hypothetical protein
MDYLQCSNGGWLIWYEFDRDDGLFIDDPAPVNPFKAVFRDPDVVCQVYFVGVAEELPACGIQSPFMQPGVTRHTVRDPYGLKQPGHYSLIVIDSFILQAVWQIYEIK